MRREEYFNILDQFTATHIVPPTHLKHCRPTGGGYARGNQSGTKATCSDNMEVVFFLSATLPLSKNKSQELLFTCFSLSEYCFYFQWRITVKGGNIISAAVIPHQRGS